MLSLKRKEFQTMKRGWQPKIEVLRGHPVPSHKREALKKLTKKVALRKLKEMETAALKKAA
jgi:hypothetical protein